MSHIISEKDFKGLIVRSLLISDSTDKQLWLHTDPLNNKIEYKLVLKNEECVKFLSFNKAVKAYNEN